MRHCALNVIEGIVSARTVIIAVTSATKRVIITTRMNRLRLYMA